MKYEKSDVIFLGKIARYTGGFVTFDVIKSWKGVDTRQITIRNGGVSACDSYPFSQSEPDRQYIVYAKKDLLEIRVTPCGGTITTDKFDIDYDSNPQLNSDLDLGYLNSNFNPIVLKVGHTMSLEIIPLLEILGSFFAVAIAAFLVIRRS